MMAFAPVAALAQGAAATCAAPAGTRTISACQQGAPLETDGIALVAAPAPTPIDVVANIPWAASANDLALSGDKATPVVTSFDPVLHQAHLSVALDAAVLHVVTVKPAPALAGAAPLAVAVITIGGLAGAAPPLGVPGIVLQLPGGNRLYVKPFDAATRTISFDQVPGASDPLWFTGSLGAANTLRAHVLVDPVHNAPLDLGVSLTPDGVTVDGGQAGFDVSLGPLSVTLAGLKAVISASPSFAATFSIKTPPSFPLKLAARQTQFLPGGIPDVCAAHLLASPAALFASNDLGLGLTVSNASVRCTPVSNAVNGLQLDLALTTGTTVLPYTALVTDHGIAFTDSRNVTTPDTLTLPLKESATIAGLEANVSGVALTLPTLNAASRELGVTVTGSAKLRGLDTIAIPPGSYTFALAAPRAGGPPSLRPLCPRDAADHTKLLSVAIPAGSPLPMLTVGPLTVTVRCNDVGKPAETWAGIDGDALPIALTSSQFATSAPLKLPAFTAGPDGLRWGAPGAPAAACLDLYQFLRPTGYDGKPVKPQPCAVPSATVAASAVASPSASDDTDPPPIPAGTAPNLSIFGFKAYVLDGTSAYYDCLPNKNGAAGCHRALAIKVNVLGTFETVTGDTNSAFSATERGLIIDTSDPTNLLGAYTIKPYHFNVAGLQVQFAGPAGDALACDDNITPGIQFDPSGDGVKACGRIVFPTFLKHEQPNLDPDLAVNAGAVGVQMDQRPTSLYVKKLWIHRLAGSRAIDSDIELDDAMQCDSNAPTPRPRSTSSFGIFQFCMPKDGFRLQSNGGALSVRLHGYLRVTKGLPTDNIAELDAAFNQSRFVAYATLTDFTARFGPNSVSVANIKIVSAPTFRSVAGDVVVQTAQFGNAEIYLQNVGIEQRRDNADAQWRSPKVIGKPDLAKTGTSFGLKIIGDFFTVFAFHGFKIKGL